MGGDAGEESADLTEGFCDERALILYVYLENNEPDVEDSVLTVSWPGEGVGLVGLADCCSTTSLRTWRRWNGTNGSD